MYGEPNDIITFFLEWPCNVKFKVTPISKPVSWKGAELGHMLPLNISHLWGVHWCHCLWPQWPWKANVKVTQILKPYSRKGAELGHMLLLNINMKAYKGSPMMLSNLHNRKSCLGNPVPPSHLTLSDLERSKLRCGKWCKIDTCIVKYCVRVNPRFQSAEKCQLSYQLQRSMVLLFPFWII